MQDPVRPSRHDPTPADATGADSLSGTLAPGLYVVSTPIGNARDITLRGLDVLRDADVLAAEDTRRLKHLMAIHGVPLRGRTPLPYHDHNGAQQRPRLLAALAAGRSVAYASDAGTPLVADPGYQLVRAAREAGHAVHAVPGASAVLAALTAAGLASDRFLFAGFLPAAQGARRAAITDLAQVPATLVLFESPARVNETFSDLCDILGDRQAALCRELTKRFEEVRRGRLRDIAAGLASDPARGEIVILVERGEVRATVADLDAALSQAMGTMRVRDAADVVSRMLGLPRADVYKAALRYSAARRDGETGE